MHYSTQSGSELKSMLFDVATAFEMKLPSTLPGCLSVGTVMTALREGQRTLLCLKQSEIDFFLPAS